MASGKTVFRLYLVLELDDPEGVSVMVTVRRATSPSIAGRPSTATVSAWLIPAMQDRLVSARQRAKKS